MDDDSKETPRNILRSREKRWSMNSQRLEEIVAELMKPISDVRRSFDTDLCALLEEYLTEAGLHALESEGELSAALGPGAPNFAELALLLQQSACIYGRKVDFLYQHVLSVSDSLHNNTFDDSFALDGDAAETPGGSGGGGAASRRKRKHSANGDFTHIEVEAHPGAVKELELRPPPTLPRLYLELEPRVLSSRDIPLTDYDGEPIGLLADYHVAWPLCDGRLIDELSAKATPAMRYRGVPLHELQAALDAAPLPPPPPPPPRCLSTCRSLSPPLDEPPLCSTPLLLPLPPTVKLQRKRKLEKKPELTVDGRISLCLNAAGRREYSKLEEYSVPAEWVDSVLKPRKRRILQARRELKKMEKAFRGFDATEGSGFRGWSAAEAAAAARDCSRLSRDSVDDGFFEQSSLGDSDASRVDDPTLTGCSSGECAWSWAKSVSAQASASLDVTLLADKVLNAVQKEEGPVPFETVLRSSAKKPTDVSRLLLATLFLANSGNVKISDNIPLQAGFKLKVLSTDASLYRAALAAEPDTSAPPAAPPAAAATTPPAASTSAATTAPPAASTSTATTAPRSQRRS